MWAPVPFYIASLLFSFLCEDSQISFLTAHIYIKLPLLPPRISPGTQCKMYWGCLVAGLQGLDPGRWDGADTSHPVCCFLQCRCSLEFELSLGSGSDPASELLPPVQDSWYWFHPQFWTFFSVLGGTVSGLVSYPKSHNNIQDRQKGQLLRATVSGWVPTCRVLPRRVSFLTSVPLQRSVEFRSKHQAAFHVPCAHPTVLLYGHPPPPLLRYSCLVDGLDRGDYGHHSALLVQAGRRTAASWPQWLAPQGHVTQAGPIRVTRASWQSSQQWMIWSFPLGFWDPTAVQRAFSGSEVRPAKQLWERLWFRDSRLIPTSPCAWWENAPQTFQFCEPCVLFCFS